MKDQALYYSHFDSPVGRLMLAGDEQSLHFLVFPTGSKAFGPRPGWREADHPFTETKRQLGEYFCGKRQTFDLPLALGGTEFRKSVWKRLPSIPFGQTRTYRWLAEQLGNRQATRAVGAANGANPISIILPCHRVIGSNGQLTGFGGGLHVKRWLLDLEARISGS